MNLAVADLFTLNIYGLYTNMSSGVTSNSKYTTYGSLRIGTQVKHKIKDTDEG